jgi:hypothetical protein
VTEASLVAVPVRDGFVALTLGWVHIPSGIVTRDTHGRVGGVAVVVNGGSYGWPERGIPSWPLGFGVTAGSLVDVSNSSSVPC